MLNPLVPAYALRHAHISFDGTRQPRHLLLPGGEKDGMRGLRTYRESRAPSPRPSPAIRAFTPVFDGLWGEGAIAAPPIYVSPPVEMCACPSAKAGTQCPRNKLALRGLRIAAGAGTRGSWGCSFLTGFALIAALASPASIAQAQSVADFYRGKTVSLVVSTATGGGYDAMARAIARFIGRHVPGNPGVLVRNMPGAGGITAMNHLYNAAEKDGTVIGLVQNGTPFEPLFGTVQARYEAQRFNWLGTPSFETAMVLLWHTVPVNTLADLRAKDTNVGASGAHSTPAFYGRVLNATLGTRMKLVNGYPGMTDGLIAMERGELDGYPSAFYSALTSTRPTWLRDKQAKAIVQYGPERQHELGDVPFALDLLANADDKLLMRAASAPLALGRPLVLPPGVLAARVAALRQALADTFADAQFKAEAEKLGLIVNAPRTGEQLQAVIADAYASPARVIERLQKLNNP
jgi:tripartite-type tricarboxylate transporter receptor subunit TctC